MLLDKTVYIDKCLPILNTQQFQQLDISPTTANKNKIQLTLLKIKSKFTRQEYKRLYPTGSNAGKYYGTAILHKFPTFGTVDQLISITTNHLEYWNRILPTCQTSSRVAITFK